MALEKPEERIAHQLVLKYFPKFMVNLAVGALHLDRTKIIITIL